MKLYTYYRSSAAYRVRIALNLKGVAHELVPIHLRRLEHHQPDYRALNPQGLVPTLEHGAAVIPQSLAIIEYLEELRPEPPLLPRPVVERALVRSLAQIIACDVHPLNNFRVTQHLRLKLGHGDEAIDAWYHQWMEEGFHALEQYAQRYSGDGRHLFGSSVTLADVVFVPQMYNARRFKVNLQPFPRLCAISAHLESLPAFAAAAPEAQPDAE